MIYGAREHNLKNIDLVIPRDKLTVITGLSGSGKSSLAFDTIYAEGQRRYLETFSAYARRFLGGFERPDVDKITGLSPVISIEQKTTNKNPRSTVGTVTEIYDFLRLLYARAGEAYSYKTGSRMVKYTDEQILELLQRDFAGKRILILAPVVKGRKGHYKDLFENLRKKGFLSVRVDGVLSEIKIGMSVDRYKIHDIELVVDKVVMDGVDLKRLKNSVATAMKNGDGVMSVMDYETEGVRYYSRHLMCPDTGISYKDPAPHTFSFNSPHGACKKCKGLGYINSVDLEKIIPDNSLSIYAGGILPLGKYKGSLIFYQIDTILKKHGATLKTPIRDLPEEALTDILYGYPGQFRLENAEIGVSSNFLTTYEGVVKYVMMQEENATSKRANKWAEQFISVVTCDKCQGQRLNQEALHYYIHGKNISELANMELSDLYSWIVDVEEHLEEKQRQIAGEILKEIRTRLKFMLDVGLEYLSLNRPSVTLSGGESQRIRLATQIGSQLVNVLYILDEPSIGLHQKDNRKLIHSLQELRDNGNSVIVVEHDKEMMQNADYIVDLGPKAGRKGGNVVAIGSYEDILKSDSLTAQYLNGQKDLLDSQRASGSENLQTLHERRDALIRERDALEEKRFAGLDLAGMQERLVELSARYDEMAKDGVGGVDTTEIDRRLQELHRKLGQRGAEQYAPKYTRHIAEVAAKVKELGAKYTREAALLKGFQPGVVCPTCRRAVSEADLGTVQTGIRASLEAITAEGRAHKGQLDELQALEKQAEETFLQFQKDDVTQISLEIEELNRQREAMDAACAASHEQRKDELESLHSQIQTVTADIEYGNLSQEKYDRLAECRELLRECQAELDAAEKAAQAEPEDYDAKIAQVESLILDKKKLLANAILYVGKRAELTFSQLKMNQVEIALNEVVKSTGEVKDVFKFTYGGRRYDRLSLSEKIRAGLEVSELVKRLTGRNYPVFIDNMESVDELTNVRPTGQIIMAKCVRGAALTVRPMGRPQVQKAA